jgi:hypothetical protein
VTLRGGGGYSSFIYIIGLRTDLEYLESLCEGPDLLVQGEDDGDGVARGLFQELPLHHCGLQSERGALKDQWHENVCKI